MRKEKKKARKKLCSNKVCPYNIRQQGQIKTWQLFMHYYGRSL